MTPTAARRPVGTLSAAAMLLLVFSLVPAARAYASPVHLDPTFGSGGTVTTSFGMNSYLGGLALQADGKVVVVGNATNGNNVDWKIARYNTNGTLDASFGSGGVLSKDFGDNDSLDTVAIQPDGKIVVGGYSRTAPGDALWTVARYNADGTPDLTFGALGLATSFHANSSNLLGVAVHSDGRIVAAGYTRGSSTVHDDIAVARYNADGSPDAGFGSGGTVVTGLNFGGTPNDRGNAVAVQPDGKTVVFGDYDTGSHRDNVVLLRYNINGTLDSSFGSGGIRFDAFLQNNGGRDLKLQPDGKIVVTGGTLNFGDSVNTYVARYNTNGSLDGTFGSGGKVITAFSTASDAATALTLAPDGTIVVAGYEGDGSAQQSAVRRFNSDGSLDTSFGTGGSFVLALSATADDSLNGIALQPDGKIVVGGNALNGGVFDWVLARLTEGPIIQELVLDASADTYVKNGQDNRNTGAGTYMRIRSDGNNRALVRFDQAALRAAIGSGSVLSATLQLAIVDNGNNWGPSGRTVDIHRMLSDWAEGNGTEADRGTSSGATWNCAIDSDITNQAKDCSGAAAWEMGQPNSPGVHPWAQTPTDTEIIVNGQTGIVEYDVTADVTVFLNGATTNNGWVLKKTDEGQTGLISFGTRESPTVAKLVVIYQQ